MNKQKTYNALFESKKNNVNQTKWFVIGSVIIVLMVLIYAFTFQLSIINKMKVIDTNGNHYSTEFLSRKEVLVTAVTKFCEDVSYYANTFDRTTLKSNQARLKFIMGHNSTNRLWSFYKKNKHYYDALNRGFTYKNNFIKILESDLTKLPFKIKYEGEVLIFEGSFLSKKLHYVATGLITERTPQYPESYLGWYMTDFKQNFIAHD